MPIQIYTDCYTAILLDKETGLTLGPTFGDTFIDPDGPAAYSNLAHSERPRQSVCVVVRTAGILAAARCQWVHFPDPRQGDDGLVPGV